MIIIFQINRKLSSVSGMHIRSSRCANPWTVAKANPRVFFVLLLCRDTSQSTESGLNSYISHPLVN